MGTVDVPTQGGQPLKMPVGTYEFGANLVSNTVRAAGLAGWGMGSTSQLGRWMDGLADWRDVHGLVGGPG